MLILPHSTAEVNNFLESFPNVFQPPRKTASLPVAALAAFIKYLHFSLRGYRPHTQDFRCSVPTDLRLFRYGIFVSLRRGSVTPPRTRARQAPSGACPFLLKKNLNAIVTRRISRTLPFLSSLLRLPFCAFPLGSFASGIFFSADTATAPPAVSSAPCLLLPAAPSPSCLLAAVFPVTPGNRTFLSFSLFPASFLLTNPERSAIIAKRKRGEGAPVRFWVWRSW